MFCGQAEGRENLICFHSSLDFYFSLVCANKDFVNLAAEQTCLILTRESIGFVLLNKIFSEHDLHIIS